MKVNDSSFRRLCALFPTILPSTLVGAAAGSGRASRERGVLGERSAVSDGGDGALAGEMRETIRDEREMRAEVGSLEMKQTRGKMVWGSEELGLRGVIQPKKKNSILM